MGRVIEAVSKSQLSMVDRIVDLKKGLIVLSNSVTKLGEFLAVNQLIDQMVQDLRVMLMVLSMFAKKLCFR